MNFRKVLSLLLALVLVFSLVACGKNTDTENTVNENTESTGETSAEADNDKNGELEEATITFWHAMNGAQDEALTELTKKFMEENPKVKVDLQNQGAYKDLQQKITATSVSPDNLPTMTQAYPDWLFNAITDGLVNELDGLVNSMEDYDDIVQGFRDGTVINGKVYSFPFNKSTEVLWYNGDIFKELNLEVPTNLDELKEVSKKIYAEKGIPGIGVDSLSNYFSTMLHDKNISFDNNFDPTTGEAKEIVEYYLEGIREGYFTTPGSERYMSGPFGNEQVAMFIGSNAGESYVKQAAEGKFEVKTARVPYESSIQQGTDLFVFEKSTDAEKKATYAYIKFLTEKENQIDWALKTGYIPVRTSALSDERYTNSDSLIAPILEEASKRLYSNPVIKGANQAYREAGTLMEAILVNTDMDVDARLQEFKATLQDSWN